jgi:CheY-like chemotaxis protein
MENSKNLSNSEIDNEIKTMERIETPDDSSPYILVIDDDIWIHKILKRYISNLNFEVICADNPVDGVALAIHKRPVLIFLDIVLPEIKGTTLLQMLKEIKYTKSIPVVILSGNLSKEILGNAFKHGAAGFISKPFDEDVLSEKIKKVLGKKFTSFLNDSEEYTFNKQL